jgi:uncharacterized protein YihD (DUF1040 family)
MVYAGTMRDPERIGRVLKLLEEFWRKWPDYRLAQIVSNAYIQSGTATTTADPYYMEDDVLEAHLTKLLADDYRRAKDGE